MPRGENKEFRERIGQLSLPLKRKNGEKRLESKDVARDKIDIEAFLTEEETFGEIWESIEAQALVSEGKDWKDMSKEELISEVEKYKSIAEDYEEDVFDGSI